MSSPTTNCLREVEFDSQQENFYSKEQINVIITIIEKIFQNHPHLFKFQSFWKSYKNPKLKVTFLYIFLFFEGIRNVGLI